VAGAAALIALLLVPPAGAATWPQYTAPTDTHETNSAWYLFSDTSGLAVGAAQDWVSNAPTEFTNELSVGLGIANYGTTDVFYVDGDQNLMLRPWDLTTVPNAPSSTQSSSTKVVPAQANGVGFLGVCEVGGTQPDVFVFYLKGDPSVAASRTTLFWRQISESWGSEHSVAMPSDFCAGASWDQVPGAGDTWFLHGKVVALQNAFAFVSMSASAIDTYVSNLLAPGSDGAVNKMTAWSPATASGQQVRDLDAIPFAYQGSTYLALGGLYGTPTTSGDAHWGTGITQWSAMQAGVRVCSIGDDGSCAAVTSAGLAVTQCPDPGPHNNGSGLTVQSGALNIRLARGGVTNGPRGDVLTVMTRTYGSLNRWLLNDNTHVQNHYITMQPELLDAFEIEIDHSEDAPTLEDSAQRYSGWQRRGLMSDGSNDLETTKTVYQLRYAEGLAQRTFFVTTLAVTDPNGPTNPSSITPSPAPSTSATPSPSASPLVYGSDRQRIVWATATSLHAHGVNVKNLDDLNDYTGVVGAVGSLDSDALQPVKVDTTDQNGDPLATPITYPYPIKADSSDLQLIGIIYGTPPMSLNGNAQSDIFPLIGGGEVNYYSSVQFGLKSIAGTTTTDTTEGGAGFSMSMEGEGKHGLKFPFEPELSWTTDREDISANALTIANLETWWPGPTETPKGYALFKQVSDFELQRYTRLDWDGGVLGNGASESVFVTNPLPTSLNGLVVKTFDLTEPASTDPMFAGMASRPDTLSWHDWLGVNPLTQAQAGGHGDLFDSSNGGTQVTLSHDAGGGYAEASFTQSKATQNDVVSNGVSAKLRIPFFSGDCSYSHKVVDTTTTTRTTQVSMGLPEPPQGQEKGSLTSISVVAYWLRANDADAYWIPDAFRSDGNYQTPWCIDYQVTDYGPQTPSAGEEPQCRVAVQCMPASGGTAALLDPQRATAAGAVLGVADGAGQLVKASPAPGFRFAGWKLHGRKVARLRDAGSRTARVSALGSGGATVVAQFKRILPRRVRVVRHSRASWSIALDRAALGEPLSSIQPWLDGKRVDGAKPLVLSIGSDAYRIPGSAWHGQKQDGHVVYTKRWRPRGWNKQAIVRLSVDITSRRWSLDVRRGRVTQPMLGVATGGLPIALACSGAAAQPDIPVACAATFRAAHTRPAGVRPGVRAKAGPVDLQGARISTAVDTRDPGAARFILAGAHVQRDLLRRSGMDLAINGTGFHVGPFRRGGGAYVATGRLADGVRTSCRYTPEGDLSLRLIGGNLADRLRSEFMTQNVTLTVGAGRDAPTGTMAPVATSISGVRPVPATGLLAR
jgi:hypothetical protein